MAFTDIGTLTIAFVLVITIDLFAYERKIGLLYIMGGVLSLYCLAWTFNNGYLITQSVYNAVTNTWVYNKVDANLIVVIFAILTLFSFLPLILDYFEPSGGYD